MRHLSEYRMCSQLRFTCVGATFRGLLASQMKFSLGSKLAESLGGPEALGKDIEMGSEHHLGFSQMRSTYCQKEP